MTKTNHPNTATRERERKQGGRGGVVSHCVVTIDLRREGGGEVGSCEIIFPFFLFLIYI